jgi:hypothetical protein
MTILSLNTQSTGLAGPQTKPHRCTMITTDNFATITSPGYLNSENKFGIPIENTDLFDVLYSFNEQTQQGTYGKFVTVLENGNFILQNAAQTDIGIPTLMGQTLLNINSNGFEPLYRLIAESDSFVPNGVFLINDDPSVISTVLGAIGVGDAGVLAAASDNVALLSAAFINQYPNPTHKTELSQGLFSLTNGGIFCQKDDSNITGWIAYNNIRFTGTATPCQTDIVYEPDVTSVTYNQPLTYNIANKYNEAANGNAGIATLVAGTVTISNTSITANSRILLTVQDVNAGTPGFLSIANKTAGVGFDILSSNNADTSIVYYEIREPA